MPFSIKQHICKLRPKSKHTFFASTQIYITIPMQCNVISKTAIITIPFPMWQIKLRDLRHVTLVQVLMSVNTLCSSVARLQMCLSSVSAKKWYRRKYQLLFLKWKKQKRKKNPNASSSKAWFVTLQGTSPSKPWNCLPDLCHYLDRQARWWVSEANFFLLSGVGAKLNLGKWDFIYRLWRILL